MMKYLGRGSIKVGDKFITYGQDVPVDEIDPKTLKRMKDNGELGSVPVPYDPNQHFEDRIKELKAENKALKKEIKDLKSKKEKTK
jgi:hypothetical protein